VTPAPVAPAPVTTTIAAPPPPPTTTALPTTFAVKVRHSHQGGIFRRGGSCEGTLEVLTDGVYFKTTTPSPDGRREDQKILFGEIEDHDIDESRLHIETEERHWNFSGEFDQLERVEEVLKANVKL
jgi:hypothetical protein